MIFGFAKRRTIVAMLNKRYFAFGNAVAIPPAAFKT
jgi:hypothetical protein